MLSCRGEKSLEEIQLRPRRGTNRPSVTGVLMRRVIDTTSQQHDYNGHRYLICCQPSKQEAPNMIDFRFTGLDLPSLGRSFTFLIGSLPDGHKSVEHSTWCPSWSCDRTGYLETSLLRWHFKAVKLFPGWNFLQQTRPLPVSLMAFGEQPHQAEETGGESVRPGEGVCI